MLLLALIALGLGGTLAFSLSKAGAAAGRAVVPTAAVVVKTMARGQWYRVVLRLLGSHPDEDRAVTELKAQGFFVLVPVPDKTDPSLRKVPGHYEGASGRLSDTPTMQVLRIEQLATPSAAVQRAVAPQALDPGIPVKIAEAVQIALATEQNPDVLDVFASSLLPDYPAAAALCKTQATLLRKNQQATHLSQALGDAASATSILANLAMIAGEVECGRDPIARDHGNTLGPGESLGPGDAMHNPSGKAILQLQRDGNLVLFRANGWGADEGALWHTGTNGKPVARATMQTDGNFVLYDGRNGARWASGTQGHPGSRLVLQDDGHLVIYQGHNPVWGSGTSNYEDTIHKGGGGLTHFVSRLANAVGGGLVSDAYNTVSKVAKPVVDVLHVVYPPTLVASAMGDLAERIAHGENVFDAVKASAQGGLTNLQRAAPYIETIVSVVPGVGPELAAGLAVGIALAEGEPLSEVAVDGALAALPGGALAHQAAKAAIVFGSALLQGKPLDVAAMGAARSALPKEPAYYRAAFDVGVGLAQGKSLQSVGFQGVKDLLAGDSAMQALELQKLAPGLLAQGKNIGDFLENKLGSELARIPGASEAVHSVVSRIVSDPTLGKLTSGDLAKKLKLAEPIARAALASVTRHGPLQVVEVSRLMRLAPTGPAPSPVRKPAMAHVLRNGPAATSALARKLLASSPAAAKELHRAALLARRGQYVAYYLKRAAGFAERELRG